MPTHEAAGREPDRQEGGHRWWALGWITPPAERDGGYDLGAPPLPGGGPDADEHPGPTGGNRGRIGDRALPHWQLTVIAVALAIGLVGGGLFLAPRLSARATPVAGALTAPLHSSQAPSTGAASSQTATATGGTAAPPSASADPSTPANTGQNQNSNSGAQSGGGGSVSVQSPSAQPAQQPLAAPNRGGPCLAAPSRANCDQQDPASEGCTGDAVTVAGGTMQATLADGMTFDVELEWSQKCGSDWTLAKPAGARSDYFSDWIEPDRHDASRFSAGWVTRSGWLISPMAYADGGGTAAAACVMISGSTQPYYGCTPRLLPDGTDVGDA